MPRRVRQVVYLLIGLLATLAGAVVYADEAPTGYAPLKPLTECLDPARARGFQVTDESQIEVDAGRRRYRLVLAYDCPSLISDHDIRLESKNPGNRICGNVGDSVVSGQHRCPIARVVRLQTKAAGPNSD